MSSPTTSVGKQLFFRQSGGGSLYAVRMQDFFLPHLQVNNYYRTLAQGEKNKDVDEYLTKALKEADSLIDGIRYRKSSLYKVACVVVQKQSDFFTYGYEGLVPLTMAQVAELAGLSESTVSRLANGNYLQTPRGLFELRFFFQRSAEADGLSRVTRAGAKHRIKELIESESPQHPLSDQAIADLLLQEGMPLSRRTVSKYRVELGIPAKSFRTCA